jgi:PleD family two-component response regulator
MVLANYDKYNVILMVTFRFVVFLPSQSTSVVVDFVISSLITSQDIYMPVMDGLTCTSQIRQYERDHGLNPKPIIALTGPYCNFSSLILYRLFSSFVD